MIRSDWPRSPLVLGFVLGRIAENNFYISITRYGAAWTLRPLVLVLIVLTVIVIGFPFLRFKGKSLMEGTAP
jgi:TctA family transporter